MSDQPPPSPPPRVHVTLPGGHRVDARLLGWQQGSDGTWHAEVALTVPAGAVTRVAGEDYAAVPRVPAERFVLVTSTPPRGKPTMVLHGGGCWTLAEVTRDQRVTPVEGGAAMARTMLRFGDTTGCDVCQPEP